MVIGFSEVRTEALGPCKAWNWNSITSPNFVSLLKQRGKEQGASLCAREVRMSEMGGNQCCLDVGKDELQRNVQ